MDSLGGIGVIGTLLLLFIAILWILLPFAVFGVKDLARDLIREQKNLAELQRKTNELLAQLAEQGVSKAPE